MNYDNKDVNLFELLFEIRDLKQIVEDALNKGEKND